MKGYYNHPDGGDSSYDSERDFTPKEDLEDSYEEPYSV